MKMFGIIFVSMIIATILASGFVSCRTPSKDAGQCNLGIGNLHIVRLPTAAQLFGCEKTFVNAQGEDTGECR